MNKLDIKTMTEGVFLADNVLSFEANISAIFAKMLGLDNKGDLDINIPIFIETFAKTLNSEVNKKKYSLFYKDDVGGRTLNNESQDYGDFRRFLPVLLKSNLTKLFNLEDVDYNFIKEVDKTYYYNNHVILEEKVLSKKISAEEYEEGFKKLKDQKQTEYDAYKKDYSACATNKFIEYITGGKVYNTPLHESLIDFEGVKFAKKMK